jgi:hypothetical protein
LTSRFRTVYLVSNATFEIGVPVQVPRPARNSLLVIHIDATVSVLAVFKPARRLRAPASEARRSAAAAESAEAVR